MRVILGFMVFCQISFKQSRVDGSFLPPTYPFLKDHSEPFFLHPIPNLKFLIKWCREAHFQLLLSKSKRSLEKDVRLSKTSSFWVTRQTVFGHFFSHTVFYRNGPGAVQSVSELGKRFFGIGKKV
jgi:hypothetical protein